MVERHPAVHVVIPTVGRPSLLQLLASLADNDVLPEAITIVDDRADDTSPLLDGDLDDRLTLQTMVVRSGGRGPAGARNLGWRTARAEWIAFLDDDVVTPPGWMQALQDDLAGLPSDVAASQGRIRVPLPTDRRPVDWERNVAGLEQARWATADMAYRREVLSAVGGFDERFPRAYREDADLGLRVTDRGWRIVRGDREIIHPVRPAGSGVSIKMQAGNADDPFMEALHGRGWRRRAGAPGGRRPWHLATVASALVAVTATTARRKRLAVAASTAWAGLTAQYAFTRIAPGPRTREEVAAMLATSAVVPIAATWHWVRGWLGLSERLGRPGPDHQLPAAVLFDRDGTLVHDPMLHGTPTHLEPVDGAREVLDQLRRLGIPIGVVTNQEAIGLGMASRAEVDDVHRRLEDVLGPIGTWAICPHRADEGCACRKPLPTLVERAASDLGVAVEDCVVIGDIGSDVEAARAAGARAILVPTPVTRAAEVTDAPEVAADLREALAMALDGRPAAATSNADG